ncbi:MAG: DNA/RNA nuclease SfsA [Rhodospirillaceae bacterium]|jgi:sugar fermentation stimulation protein A
MKFPDPLIRGKLIKRYKRFLTDVELEDGSIVVAHCANPGSMLSVNDEGAEVWLSPARNPERKLRYTWELIRIGRSLVGINTAKPNALIEEAIQKNIITELSGYDNIRREVKYGKNSRIDLLLESPNKPPCYVEVKSVTMKRDRSKKGPYEFPDAVTKRGTKHLGELSDMVKQGHRAVMMYLAQRQDGQTFTVAGDIDPDYAKALKSAIKAGVEAICYDCKLTSKEIKVATPVPIDF